MDGELATEQTTVALWRLGRYVLQEQIGSGGMGVVHRATDAEGNVVAIKLLRPHVAADGESRERFAREVRVLSRVRGRHIAEVQDADVAAETPYLVTRYVDGSSLHDVVTQQGPLQGTALESLAADLADALCSIHRVGVVHRDLKPGNVLVCDGEAVVIDFGISQIVDETRMTVPGMVFGTPGYLAPELLSGGAVTPAVDVHAWAATVTYAATGRPPFGRGRFDVVSYRVVHESPDLTDVPTWIEPILAHCLAKDPNARPSARELYEWLESQDLQERPDGAGSLVPAPMAATGGAGSTTGTVGTSNAAAGGPNGSVEETRPSTPAEASGAAPGSERPGADIPYDWATEAPDDWATEVSPSVSGAGAAGAAGIAGAVAGPHRSSGPTAAPAGWVEGDNYPEPGYADPDAETHIRPPEGPIPYGHPGEGTGYAGARPRLPAAAPAGWNSEAGGGAEARPVGPHPPGTDTVAYPPDAAPDETPPDGAAPADQPGEVAPAAGWAYPKAPAAHRFTVVALTVTLCALAAVVPAAALGWLAVWVVAVRIVDCSASYLEQRRAIHGRRRTDGLAAAGALPWHGVRSVIASALFLVVAVICGGAAVSFAVLLATAASVEVRVDAVAAAAVLCMVAAAWWGPGGEPVRRGSYRIWAVSLRPGWVFGVFSIILAGAVVALGVTAWMTDLDPWPAREVEIPDTLNTVVPD